MDNKDKEFREERFEFALYVNNNLICKRNFKINNFIDDSMTSIDFKHKVDDIVEMINSDLKSKSRVYTWYYYDENSVDEEFTAPLLEPWACTFKFVVTDNKKEVISKIWDGYAYPKAVREKVDIANKLVKITSRDGTRTYTYDKESFFASNADKLSPENYVLRAMIMDKPDLLVSITKKICETCSTRDGMYKCPSDYTLSEMYRNKKYELDENGKLLPGKYIQGSKRYIYSANLAYRKMVADWGKSVSSKTKKYLSNLY
jgi:YD repeat-containing protein